MFFLKYRIGRRVLSGGKIKKEKDMVKFNSVAEFAQYTDMSTLQDIQIHVNKAVEHIREDSLGKGIEGSATASISIALHEESFLLIEFNYSWLNGEFTDNEEVRLTLLSMDEWLDYYNDHKSDFKIVKSDVK